MKTQATLLEPPKAFVPVKLEIIFETQDELDRFATIFNFTPITDRWLSGSGFADLPGANPHKTHELREAIMNHPATYLPRPKH